MYSLTIESEIIIYCFITFFVVAGFCRCAFHFPLIMSAGYARRRTRCVCVIHSKFFPIENFSLTEKSACHKTISQFKRKWKKIIQTRARKQCRNEKQLVQFHQMEPKKSINISYFDDYILYTSGRVRARARARISE